MAGNTERTPTDPTVLDVVGDDDCRRLIRLLASDGPQSVRTLHERTDIAQSTLYRKMDRVSDTPLVLAETHLDAGGRQPTRYRLVADELRVELDDPIEVSVGLGGDADDGTPDAGVPGIGGGTVGGGTEDDRDHGARRPTQ